MIWWSLSGDGGVCAICATEINIAANSASGRVDVPVEGVVVWERWYFLGIQFNRGKKFFTHHNNTTIFGSPESILNYYVHTFKKVSMQ